MVARTALVGRVSTPHCRTMARDVRLPLLERRELVQTARSERIKNNFIVIRPRCAFGCFGNVNLRHDVPIRNSFPWLCSIPASAERAISLQAQESGVDNNSRVVTSMR